MEAAECDPMARREADVVDQEDLGLELASERELSRRDGGEPRPRADALLLAHVQDARPQDEMRPIPAVEDERHSAVESPTRDLLTGVRISRSGREPETDVQADLL